MKLLTLRISNFMPYRGEQVMTFPVTETRNVTLVHGDNMRGKTSLLNALRWVLYGEVVGRHLRRISSIDILNKDAAFDRDFVVKVSLSFTHGAHEYELVRTMQPKDLIDKPRDDDHFDSNVSMRRDGVPISGHLVESEIGNILPNSISRFSFFDGELLQEYEQLVADATESSDRIKDAIERALGVPTLINGRLHVAELLHRAQRQFAKEGNKDSQHAKLMQQTLDELEDAKSEQTRLTDLFHNVSEESETLDDELRKYERAESVGARLKELRESVAGLEETRARALQRRRSLAPQAWLAVLSSDIAARKEDAESRLLQSQKAYEDAVRSKVEHSLRLSSLESGSCALCQQDLTSTAVADISRRESQEAPSGDASAFSNDLATLARQLQRLRGLGAVSVGSEIIQAEREYDRTTIDIARMRQREEDLVKEVPGIDMMDISRKRQRKDLLQREIGKLDTQVSAQQSKCAGIQKKYDTLVKAAAGGQEASSQLIARKVTLLSSLAEIFEKSVDKLRHKLRGKVEEAATDTFRRLTTEKQYSGLKINDQYGLEIRDHMDRTVSVRSAGAEQIVALSLIDGLSHASNSAGLLVMDTPFGRLDLKHRAEVLSYLPRMAQQVVLLVHEGELSKDRDLAHVADRVSAAYEIERISPTQSRIVAK
jgi:DNA sulfur modification protein DndD